MKLFLSKSKELSLSQTLHEQSDKANNIDCASILESINCASLKGEYAINLKIKVNQAKYLKNLGLTIKDNEKGYYEISW
jgi:hypothetical protein